MATLIHFVRHGETTANAGRVIAGATDVALTENGRAQAAALRETVGRATFDHVWSSDLQRAVETAQLAGLEPTPDPRVRELNFGDLEGAPWADVIEQNKVDVSRFGDFHAPNGESVREMVARVHAFADELRPGRHAVFCHGGVIRVVLARFGYHHFVPNCAVVGVNWSAGTLLLDPLTTVDLT